MRKILSGQVVAVEQGNLELRDFGKSDVVLECK